MLKSLKSAGAALSRLPERLQAFGSWIGAFPRRFNSLETRLENLGVAQQQTGLVQQQTNTETQRLVSAQLRLQRTLLSLALRRREFREDPQACGLTLAPPLSAFEIAQTYAILSERYPQAFQLWKTLSDTGNQEYFDRPGSSLSVAGNLPSLDFSGFARAHMRGRVLDIGCGPQAVPAYLEGYPTRLIAAIDPFSKGSHHPFLFVRALNEQLPWPDASFETVINATSMDHCVDLEASLAETARVMAPNATLILWVGFVKGAKPYDPNAPAAIDAYHLYHFDEPWFNEVIARYFRVIERVDNDGISNFYALRRIQHLATVSAAGD